MPLEVPPTKSFLDAVTACTWSGGVFVDPSGAHLKPNAQSGTWALSALGLWTTAGDAALLHGATMSADGLGFVAASGAGYLLEWAGEYARAVAR